MSEDNNNDDKLLYCSFCGKSQHEVKKLIAGPSVFVCDECVDLCNDIIREELLEVSPEEEQEHLPTPREITEDSSRLLCYFCRMGVATKPIAS